MTDMLATMDYAAIRSLGLALATAGGLLLPARAGPQLDSLVSNSPFKTEVGSSAQATPDQAPYQFRGMIEEDGRRYFSIYQASSKRSVWAPLKADTPLGLTVTAYDPANREITILANGQSHVATLSSLPSTVSTASPAPTAPQATPAAAFSTQQEATQKQRIENIRKEIARRRAIRQKLLAK